MTSVLPQTPPEFSLVLTTRDRTAELARFLDSLDRQTFRSFELIVSDQNDDDRLEAVLAPFRDRFPIAYVRSSGGASAGRNAGLRLVRGRLVGFPDDDCWYPRQLLETVHTLFDRERDWDLVCGRSVDGEMRGTQGRWYDRVVAATRTNILRIGIAYTIFARAEAAVAAGPFDETLGVGAGTRWGSGEETDFLLQALHAGKSVYYTPDIYVHHVEKVTDYSRRARDRQFVYARGVGRVLRKHSYSLFEAFGYLARPLAGAALFLGCGRLDRSLHHLRVFAGRGIGWIGS